MAEALNDLYAKEWSLFRNFFCPVMKLVRTEVKGSRRRRVYDEAMTPFERLKACKTISPKDWIVRLENPSASEIWDQDYKALGEMENEYRFDEWTGPENWIPTPFIEEKGLLEKWRSLTKP